MALLLLINWYCSPGTPLHFPSLHRAVSSFLQIYACCESAQTASNLPDSVKHLPEKFHPPLQPPASCQRGAGRYQSVVSDRIFLCIYP